MGIILQTAITVICSVIASSGFWAYFQHKSDKKDAKTQMLVGLGHDRIVYLGMKYIERKSISKDEYENLNDYLFEPYSKLGGNGSARKIMDEVRKLPIKNYSTEEDN